MKKEKLFATEADLCAAFIATVNPEEWTVYAETAGWDILLARKSDGFQIGIQAKLQFNAHVVSQTLETWRVEMSGPDCRAVLVPDSGAKGLSEICHALGITVITIETTRWGSAWGVNESRDKKFVSRPELPTEPDRHRGNDKWHERAPVEREKLPQYVPDVVAGAAAPVQLTEWKIKAIKIAVTLEKRGFLTREDFKHIGINIQRWMPNQGHWLRVIPGGYVAGKGLPNFKAQHPRVYDEIAADAETWMLKSRFMLETKELSPATDRLL